MNSTLIQPVVLSGGAGTRLWPISQASRPKQFLALAGDRTMLQSTVARVTDNHLFAAAIIVGSASHADLIEAQLHEVEITPRQLILEPYPRNTAPAITLAAHSVAPDQLLLVMPSDHVIGNRRAFLDAVAAARQSAEQGWLITLGVRPTRAETGYGYIKRGSALTAEVFRADCFVEKPDPQTAAAYVRDGSYDWNAGIFLFRADRLLEEMASRAPEVVTATKASIEGAELVGSRLYPAPSSFARSPGCSIDHAVMEKADRVAVAPVDMEWSDVGSWEALYDVGGPDHDGNVRLGDVKVSATRNSLVRSEGPTVVTMGINNLIVVATRDAVLVVPRGMSQGVKEAIGASTSFDESAARPNPDVGSANRRPDAILKAE
jgi:mannose-1-phosphate guanylyltransferase